MLQTGKILESAVDSMFYASDDFESGYLYLSPDKDADLQRVVQGLSAAGMIPVAGEVLKLLLMICWASAEAAVDCAGLAEGGKVPLMRTEIHGICPLNSCCMLPQAAEKPLNISNQVQKDGIIINI